jgi:hypothetical protein
VTPVPSCATCRFAAGSRDHGPRACKRHAPAPHAYPALHTHWPIVAAHDWCGEYQAREAPAPEEPA